MASIIWDQEPRQIAADPIATITLTRDDWQAQGAKFYQADDGDGEMPYLATGCFDDIEFGVLDYDDGITYLLIPGDTDEEQRENLDEIFGVLAETMDLDGVSAAIPFNQNSFEVSRSSDEVLQAIDAAEEQIRLGTMTPLEDILKDL